MANEDGMVQNAIDDPQVEDWAAAFEAFEKRNQKDPEEPEGASGDAAEEPDGSGHTGAAPAGEDQGEPEVPDGGRPYGSGMDGDDPWGQGGSPVEDQVDVDSIIEELNSNARSTAIETVAKAFRDKGARHSADGMLGASIDDPDVCKRDEDGVPTFYNPETGRRFTGENPRAQAQEWVDGYNRQLADAFNQECARVEADLLKENEPIVATLRFQPTYDKLDDVRKSMLDDLLSDYEVKDSDGDVIGYSCDLDKALAVVNRQVASIQKYARNRSASQPTGPALDMRNSSGVSAGVDEVREPRTLEEAFEMQQDKLLSDFKKKGRR